MRFHTFVAAIVATIMSIGIAPAAQINHTIADNSIRDAGIIIAEKNSSIINKNITAIARNGHISSIGATIGIASIIPSDIRTEAKIGITSIIKESIIADGKIS
jgi:hypothetical protein